MPSQRPFFANLFAAFRAHNAFKSAGAPSSSPTAGPNAAGFATQHPSASAASPSAPAAPRTIANATKPTSPLSAAAAAAFSPPPTRHHHHHHHSHHHPHHPPSSPSGATASAPRPIARSPNSAFGAGAAHRRGSDSSSDGSSGGRAGFRDALGGEKWFIGGRTAAGEERFYKLAMVPRERSAERASLDRMSL